MFQIPARQGLLGSNSDDASVRTLMRNVSIHNDSKVTYNHGVPPNGLSEEEAVAYGSSWDIPPEKAALGKIITSRGRIVSELADIPNMASRVNDS
jgi:hypothetical protein